MLVIVTGPDTDGEPSVHIEATGRYSPDVMHDLTQRAIDTYRTLWPDWQGDPDDPIDYQLADEDEDDTA